jgi:hypothetical protein
LTSLPKLPADTLLPNSRPPSKEMSKKRVTGFQAQTRVKVDWKILPPDERAAAGVRYIEGIAYNAAIKGERRRVTCSLSVWCNPNEDIFYGDESVRWTEAELRELNLKGVPLKPLHHPTLPPVGHVVRNWVDPAGHLHICGELDGSTAYGKQMIEFLDDGVCHELSIGYPLWRDDATGEVSRLGVEEISIVPQAHFRGCKVNIQAASAAGGGKAQPEAPELPYTLFQAVRAGKERNTKMRCVGSSNVRRPYSDIGLHAGRGFVVVITRIEHVARRTCRRGHASWHPQRAGEELQALAGPVPGGEGSKGSR